MKEYTIAEILHYAADKCLAAKASEYWVGGGNKEKFSCCAVELSTERLYKGVCYEQRLKILDRIYFGLEAMGCPVASTTAFGECGVSLNKENQQARYAWLKFAAMMAEEQGV